MKYMLQGAIETFSFLMKNRIYIKQYLTVRIRVRLFAYAQIFIDSPRSREQAKEANP